MADLPRAKVEINDFSGLLSHGDPNDIPPGAAQVQLNVSSRTPGELRSRPAWEFLNFEE